MQLVAYGAQDIYLTGNPQITFFKIVYRRHTNFSMESIRQTWNGQSDKAGTCTATISRNGDLIHKCYIHVVGTANASETPLLLSNPGAKFIKNVDLEIGGQRIDRQSGKFMEVYAELTQPNPTCFQGIIEDDELNQPGAVGTKFQRMSGMGGVISNASAGLDFLVPLQFWFCRNAGNALPLIALQYHEVKVILDHDITSYFGARSPTNDLYVDYIYLDTDERRRFAQVSHEYLIEQVQHQTVTSSNGAINFNHPVKELIFSNNASNLVKDRLPYAATYGLSLNGHERFQERDRNYFTRQQVNDYHTGAGGITNAVLAPSASRVIGLNIYGINANDSIGVYSFALKPEEHQPSGTCNFSRIDSAQFVIKNDSSGYIYDIFAINYNVLRIMSGMGGLAYSN